MTEGTGIPFDTAADIVLAKLTFVVDVLQRAKLYGLDQSTRADINKHVDAYEAALNGLYKSPEWGKLGHGNR